MPVPRYQQLGKRADYILVRETGPDGDNDVDNADPTAPTPVVDQSLDAGSNLPRQAWPTTAEVDSDSQGEEEEEEEEEDYPTPSSTQGQEPPLFLVTMTLPEVQEATRVASENNDLSETVVVAFTSPPGPPPRPPPPNKGGISQTTEHLLIAAGSIGATIIVAMIVLAVYTMRKRGMTLAEAFKHGKHQVRHRGGPPPPPKGAQSEWDAKQEYSSDYSSTRGGSVAPPHPAAALARSESTTSQRPLMALQHSDSFKQQVAERNASSNTMPQSFLLDSSPRSNSHSRNDSATPSSPILPVQQQRTSASTHNTRSGYDEESEHEYHDLTQEQAMSPLPPPPTFKQFLSNRPSISGRPGIGGGGMVSRFSWTNSNAPQTPHDPHRDTNSHTIGRDSFMTQRSSVPRFRTVDSWVNQQTNRLEAQKLKEQFRLTQTSTVYSGEDEGGVPEVPVLPKNVKELRQSSANEAQRVPVTPTPASGGLPGKNVKHERHDTHTTVETAPIFRQHPGTEVRFSTRSVVPSEILDMGPKPNVLS